mmetsp:Transcript_47188/g.142892  ORF Transcript_47188/g.142892 Transcript_47188/m.142892 type:complete len:217 (+) Transcript_47188:863-1513(+)
MGPPTGPNLPPPSSLSSSRTTISPSPLIFQSFFCVLLSRGPSRSIRSRFPRRWALRRSCRLPWWRGTPSEAKETLMAAFAAAARSASTPPFCLLDEEVLALSPAPARGPAADASGAKRTTRGEGDWLPPSPPPPCLSRIILLLLYPCDEVDAESPSPTPPPPPRTSSFFFFEENLRFRGDDTWSGFFCPSAKPCVDVRGVGSGESIEMGKERVPPI